MADSHPSTRVVLDTKDATSQRVKCFSCGKLGHRRPNRTKRGSAEDTPGSHAGRERWAAGLSSNGRRAAGFRRRTGHTSSPVRQEQETVCRRSEELLRIMLPIERLSDALERHGDILAEGNVSPKLRRRSRVHH